MLATKGSVEGAQAEVQAPVKTRHPLEANSR
jgi:hypothetical protein